MCTLDKGVSSQPTKGRLQYSNSEIVTHPTDSQFHRQALVSLSDNKPLENRREAPVNFLCRKKECATSGKVFCY